MTLNTTVWHFSDLLLTLTICVLYYDIFMAYYSMIRCIIFLTVRFFSLILVTVLCSKANKQDKGLDAWWLILVHYGWFGTAFSMVLQDMQVMQGQSWIQAQQLRSEVGAVCKVAALLQHLQSRTTQRMPSTSGWGNLPRCKRSQQLGTEESSATVKHWKYAVRL